jgi:hypothetical protein
MRSTTSKRASTVSAPENRASERQSRASTSPTATGAEVALVGAAISGGKLTYEVALQVVKYLKSKEPLAVQVLDSRKVKTDGEIYLRLTNLSGHGLCVFAIVSTRPVVAQPQVRRVQRPDSGDALGFIIGESKPANWEPVDPALPFVIPPTESQDVRLVFDLTATKKEIFNDLHGVVRIDFEVLGNRDPEASYVTFRFREDEPIQSRFAANRIR